MQPPAMGQPWVTTSSGPPSPPHPTHPTWKTSHRSGTGGLPLLLPEPASSNDSTKRTWSGGGVGVGGGIVGGRYLWQGEGEGVMRVVEGVGSKGVD